ncbi:MAG: hypothetical protein KBD24_00585 [Candidatus Pacebacteria bacterium]|nr:hypothetical protein [Candidatus Paceibacterota bacterium]
MRELIVTLPNWTILIAIGFSLVIYVVTCILGWYIVAGIGYSMNSGQLGRSKWFFPFECFIEELPCYLPGGRRHRIAFIKDRVGNHEGTMAGLRRLWTYQQIRKSANYEEVFFEMMGGRFRFWSYHASVFILGPLFVCLALILLIVIGIRIIAHRFAPANIR